MFPGGGTGRLCSSARRLTIYQSSVYMFGTNVEIY
jgi:hypothetical protein